MLKHKECWWSANLKRLGYMNVFSAIILGAGIGDRMDGIDKILTEICGLPAILHSVHTFLISDTFESTVVVANSHNIAELERLMSGPEYQSVQVVLGGNLRQDSVKNGLAHIESADYVMIHDGARPCVSVELIERAVKSMESADAAIPVVPITDTVKMLQGSEVGSTLDRSDLYFAQTPQVFKFTSIVESHQLVTSGVTDDSSVVEILGGTVSTFDGDPENIKITNPIDIEIVEMILEKRKTL